MLFLYKIGNDLPAFSSTSGPSFLAPDQASARHHHSTLCLPGSSCLSARGHVEICGGPAQRRSSRCSVRRGPAPLQPEARQGSSGQRCFPSPRRLGLSARLLPEHARRLPSSNSSPSVPPSSSSAPGLPWSAGGSIPPHPYPDPRAAGASVPSSPGKEPYPATTGCSDGFPSPPPSSSCLL